MKKVKITYNNGWSNYTAVNKCQTNEAIRAYFAIDSVVNIGNVIDHMVKIVNVEVTE